MKTSECIRIIDLSRVQSIPYWNQTYEMGHGVHDQTILLSLYALEANITSITMFLHSIHLEITAGSSFHSLNRLAKRIPQQTFLLPPPFTWTKRTNNTWKLMTKDTHPFPWGD